MLNILFIARKKIIYANNIIALIAVNGCNACYGVDIDKVVYIINNFTSVAAVDLGRACVSAVNEEVIGTCTEIYVHIFKGQICNSCRVQVH